MKKGQSYRVCLKSSNFEDIPTFRIKIGKTEKKINPYFIPSDKQRYNCDSILQRNNQQPQLILSVFFGYKFVGSGSISFDKPDMPNQRVQIVNRDKQKIASIDCSLIKINKVVQVPALLVEIKTLIIDNLGPKDMTNSPYFVLKYGQLNYQTQKQPLYSSQGQYVFGQSFRFPESQMERIIVQIWCEIGGAQKFLGVCLIYLRQKEDINKQVKCEISYMSKKCGTAVIKICQDKQKGVKAKDYSNAPKRTIKATIVQAVMLNPPRKGTYIKITLNNQTFETTPLFVQAKELRWNQAFTMQVNSEKQQLIAQLFVKEQGLQNLGRAFLEISKVGNRTYELTLLDSQQRDIGKIYLQFYDHGLNVKEKKTISKQLADKIGADLQSIKNRYRCQQPLHQYLQKLHVVLSEGIVMVSQQKPQNPLKTLGQFLFAYKKH